MIGVWRLNRSIGSLCLTRIGMHTQIRFMQSFSAGRPPSGLGFEIQRTRDTSATHRAYVTTHRAGTTFLHHIVVSCVHILCLSVGNTTVIFPTTKGSWLSPSAGKALRSCLCLVNYKYKKFKITYILKQKEQCWDYTHASNHLSSYAMHPGFSDVVD